MKHLKLIGIFCMIAGFAIAGALLVTHNDGSYQCTAMDGNKQCTGTITLEWDYRYNHVEMYCAVHSTLYLKWRQCVLKSDYTDGELYDCDQKYGNPSFDMRVTTFGLKKGKVFAYDPK